jgi:hypothetical protein
VAMQFGKERILLRSKSIFSTLQGKMSFLFVLMAVIPALVIGYVAHNKANGLLDIMTQRSHQDQVTRVADRLDQYLQDGRIRSALWQKRLPPMLWDRRPKQPSCALFLKETGCLSLFSAPMPRGTC